MPLFHGHGLLAVLLATLASGGCVLLPDSGRFSAHSFWDDMQESFADLGRPFALREAFSSAAQLRYLDGGGDGDGGV